MENQIDQITSLLLEFDIEYWLDGKNVSYGAVNVCCPYCEDPSNHCGMFPTTMIFSCWRCSSRGPVFVLIATLLNISHEAAKNLLNIDIISFKKGTTEQLTDIFKQAKQKQEEDREQENVFLPEYSERITTKTSWPLLEEYLIRRQITKQTLIYNQCSICRVGESMNRLIIPVYSKGDLVAYQAADLTGRSELKYKTSGGHINDFLYGYDAIDNMMFVCEGVLDAWRIGIGAACCFGTSLTDIQRQLIIDKQLECLIFVWDHDAYWKQKKQSSWFGPFIETVKYVCLPQGYDPDRYGKTYGEYTLHTRIVESLFP